MVKTRKSSIGDRQQRAEKTNRCLELFKFWKYRKVDSKKKQKRFKGSSKDNILYGNFGNDILISRSGQAKIDNLDSCLNLERSDFIVF
ncbi:MAG: hypothetical protein QNJ32_01320 [Xenococcaceae cyanobacterium MO_167.B27]|nr:hypothetical protein [Xenococcaceae cyanobacterium MO_167.B27]